MNVSPLLQGEVSPKVSVAVHRLDQDLAAAVSAAVQANVPRGFVIALLHTHLHLATQDLLENAE